MLLLLLLSSCKTSFNLNTLGPALAQVSEPGTQTLSKNGGNGTWFSAPVLFQLPAGTSALGVNVTDPYTQDSRAVQISLSSPGALNFMLAPDYSSVSVTCQDVQSYYANGHLQFDLRLDQALSGSLNIYFGCGAQGSYGPTNYQSSLALSGITAGAFQHYSFAIKTFSGTLANQTLPVNTPLYLVFPSSSSGAVATFNDIKWTLD